MILASWPFLRRSCVIAPTIVAGLLAWTGAVAQTGDWPRLPSPRHLDSFEVGQRIKLNGVPLKIKGYLSDRPVSELNGWYRRTLGGQWVENRVGHKTVIGQRQGEYFVSVEFEPVLSGLSGSTTKVVVSIMDLNRQTMRPGQADDGLGGWAARLPLSSRVLSHMTDSTPTHESLHLVATNGHSAAYNAQHFRREFRHMGFHEDAAAVAADAQRAPASSTTGAPHRLSFSGPGTDAVLVLGRETNGQSTVVLILNRSKR